MPSGEEIDNQKFVEAASDSRTANNTMRHQYPILSDEEKDQMQNIKDLGLLFEKAISMLGSKREYSIAKTKIEEAVMWAVKGLTA
jgi:hypothetical protein